MAFLWLFYRALTATWERCRDWARGNFYECLFSTSEYSIHCWRCEAADLFSHRFAVFIPRSTAASTPRISCLSYGGWLGVLAVAINSPQWALLAWIPKLKACRWFSFVPAKCWWACLSRVTSGYEIAVTDWILISMLDWLSSPAAHLLQTVS